MLAFQNLIPQLDSSVESLLQQQVVDPNRPDYGGFIGRDGLANPSSVSSVAQLGYAYLLEESHFAGSAELLERILMATASGLWRVRRGASSATAAAGLTSPFSLKFGKTELTAVKLSSTYFATGQFVGEEFQGDESRVRMRHLGRNAIYPERDYVGGVYWLPIDEKVTAENWVEVRGKRETFTVPPLEVNLEIQEVDGGFDLHIETAGGLDPVPFQIECVFARGGELEMECGVVEGKEGNTVLLKGGQAIYRVGDDAISIGPGEMRHLMWQMRNSELSPEGFRVLITLMTPVDRTLEIRCGTWSWGTGELV